MPLRERVAALSDIAFVLARRVCNVPELDMRVAILREEVVLAPPEVAVELIAVLCREAEARSPAAVEALPALLVAIGSATEALREQLAALARERGHDAVERIARVRASGTLPTETDAHVPDYGAGRPLTLGERKAIARRPRRDLIERAIGDPHPEVIRRLLENPRVTETDVIRICARRPCPQDVLRAVAASRRWIGRTRVRGALVKNPSTPPEVAIPLLTLLLRQELREVAQSSELDPAVRAASTELLRVRPPSQDETDPTVH